MNPEEINRKIDTIYAEVQTLESGLDVLVVVDFESPEPPELPFRQWPGLLTASTFSWPAGIEQAQLLNGGKSLCVRCTDPTARGTWGSLVWALAMSVQRHDFDFTLNTLLSEPNWTTGMIMEESEADEYSNKCNKTYSPGLLEPHMLNDYVLGLSVFMASRTNLEESDPDHPAEILGRLITYKPIGEVLDPFLHGTKTIKGPKGKPVAQISDYQINNHRLSLLLIWANGRQAFYTELGLGKADPLPGFKWMPGPKVWDWVAKPDLKTGEGTSLLLEVYIAIALILRTVGLLRKDLIIKPPYAARDYHESNFVAQVLTFRQLDNNLKSQLANAL